MPLNLLLVRYVLVAAKRDRLLWSMLAVLILGACLSVLSSSAAIIEQGQFVVAYMGGGLRIICLIGLSLFTVFFIRRMHDSREIEFLLTRPISRLTLVLSQSLAFSFLSIGCGAILTLLLALVAAKQGAVDGVLLWGAGITFESVIVVNVAYFFAMVLTSPVTAGIATFGFYVLARLMGQLLAISQIVDTSGAVGLLMRVFKYVIEIIAVVIPRFDLMAQTSWLLYGAGEVLGHIAFLSAQITAFIALILTATYFDLKRRQF